MTLSVYNTLSNKTETFEPLEPGKIKMYACGVTVYDLCHIGHGMQAIIYDVIRNFFKFMDYQVLYVRNYTDVDDKIIDRANSLGINPLEHSENMIAASLQDLALLDVKPADIEPKVSDHIPEIITLIESLIQRGAAYAADGDVYFSVKNFPEYGQLSNRNVDELRSGARIEINQKKADPLDFALWKAAKPGEVSWDSPWGAGRPGWHIECSALAMKYLGEHFDIHGGGKDLIFPHHENEIAQSLCGCDGKFANYWIHNGLVTVEGRKMSKSFNNFMTIRDAVEKYYYETLRYTILSHQYSANIDFSDKAFYDAYSRLLYFYNTFLGIEQLKQQVPDYPTQVPPGIEIPDVKAQFIDAMNDDFNTAVALSRLGGVFKFLNDLMTAKKPKLKQKLHVLVETATAVKDCLAVLGLIQRDPEEALQDIQNYLIKARRIDVDRVKALLTERETARTDKNWAEADRLRDALKDMGIAVMDTPQGTRWEVMP